MFPVLMLSGILSVLPRGDFLRTPYLGFHPEKSIMEQSIEYEMREFSAYLRKHLGYLVEMIGTSPAFEQAWFRVQAAMRWLGAASTEPEPERSQHQPSKAEAPDALPASDISDSLPPPCDETQPNSPEPSSPFSPLGGHLEHSFPLPIPAHEVVRKLAQGAYGTVELAKLETGRLIVIKTINILDMAQKMTGLWYVSPECIAQVGHILEVEFRALQQIGEHPYIVQLIGSERRDNLLRIAMPYIDGEPLSRYCGQLEEAVARDIIKQILIALEHCHQRRVVHSDLKPDNVVIKNGREVTLIDLGGSRMTRRTNPDLPIASIFPGTPPYYDDPLETNANLNPVQRDVIAAGRTLQRILQGPISESAKRFIEHCERGEAISELLNDPWLQD